MSPIELRRRHRPPEPIALPQLTSLFEQESSLFDLLDPLRMYLHAHALRQGNDHP
ncbi:hypothetical protein D3C75_1276130 [compost metagenome]